MTAIFANSLPWSRGRAAVCLTVWLSCLLCTTLSLSSAELSEVEKLYRIAPGDELDVRVFDESDLSERHRVDSRGDVRLALIGTVTLAGMTVREAEDRIEFLYVENRILRKPMVNVRVSTFAAREVTVVGQVQKQGTLEFPPGINSMNIVDVIAKCGGFTQRARPSEVAILRIGPSGEEIKTPVNVSNLLRESSSDVEIIYVFPGDKVLVPPVTW